jgi:hypothetical protein
MDHLDSDKDSEGGHRRKRAWTGGGGHCEERQPRKRRGAPASYCIPDREETSSASVNILEPLCFLSRISAVEHFIEDTVNSPFMTEVIIGVLSKRKSDLNFQISGIRALSACASTTDDALNGFVDAIVSAMEEHPYDTTLQIEGCRTLRQWAKMDARRLRVISNRGVGRVLPITLNRHPKSLALQILGLDLLRALVACCSEERSHISQNPEFIATLLQILEKHVKYSCIQQIGLSLLSWLVEDGNTKDAIIRDGGVSFILKAMHQHADDQMVQCNGAATLCWLIHTGGQERSVDDFISDGEGIKTILQTMSRYIENPSVFGNCVCILSGVRSNRAADIEHLVGLEVLGMVVLGMQNHIQSPKVQRNCLTWLRLLTNQSMSSHDILLKFEVLEAVAAAMREHSGDAGIQIQACNVLANLCATTKVRDILSSSNCIEMVVNSQLEHKSNIRLQQAAIWFHNCILENQVGQENVASFGGGVELVNALLMGIVGQRSGAEEP